MKGLVLAAVTVCGLAGGMLALGWSGGAPAAAPGAAAAPAAKPEAANSRPLVFVFQKQKDPTDIKAKAEEVAAFLAKETGRPFTAVVPTDYAASVQALVSGKADFAYVSAIPFLLAQRDAKATLVLAEQRPDLTGTARTSYDSVLVAKAESPLTGMADVVKRAKDLRLAFTSRTSTSGYVMPYSRFVDEGLLKARQNPAEAFKAVAFAGSYTQALQAVLDGRAEVAAVSAYTVEGPTADAYLPSADRQRLKVVARMPNVPTHLICVRGGVEAEVVAGVRAALLKLAKEKPDLLSAVYGASALVEVDAAKHLEPVRQALERLGEPIEGFAR
ncbi:MAG: phosphate/phosphite/phosphonate ABC transporter substrate-binding protein [Planctomycetaceae bacterium]|jgi:phosphonate transport system substrate-binding protein|nr:phosphate/phosphite/phosphonate ABC transporter substrate-binding protein [Phycisphaerales bacterium]MCE2654119.1 phosphate/phosphite/phosphonate ABC transporter substrate-binding protein [Planctomycetaceae bacterium]